MRSFLVIRHEIGPGSDQSTMCRTRVEVGFLVCTRRYKNFSFPETRLPRDDLRDSIVHADANLLLQFRLRNNSVRSIQESSEITTK